MKLSFWEIICSATTMLPELFLWGGVAPCVKENHGTVTAVLICDKTEYKQNNDNRQL